MTQETRKQQLKDRINTLASSIPESDEPRNFDEFQKLIVQRIYAIDIELLKKFVDKDCVGEPLEIIVESPYHDGKVTEDRFYMASFPETPDYEQVVFDQLKKYNLVQEDSQLNDYSFLFPRS